MCYRDFLSEKGKKDICVIQELGNHETSLQMLGKEMKKSFPGSMARSYKGEIKKTEREDTFMCSNKVVVAICKRAYTPHYSSFQTFCKLNIY